MGGGLGHLTPFSPVARALRDRGHRVTLCVKQVGSAEFIFGAEDFEYLQAPEWPQELTGAPRPPMNYCEVLINFGWLREVSLRALTRAWRNLMVRLEPALVIADHAPTALLAALSLDLPRAAFGTGFCSPPCVSPFPSFRPWLNLPEQRFIDEENRALQVANSVLGSLGHAPMPNLVELFRSMDEDFLLTLPELDHFGEREGVTYWGPINISGQGVPAEWPALEGPRVFAYLKPAFSQFDAVVQRLRVLNWPTVVYAGAAAESLQKQFGGASISYSSEPLDMTTVTRECDVAVCHAGQGTLTACLLAGKPLLLLPTQVEQRMLGQNAVNLGAADMLLPGADVSNVDKNLARVMESPIYSRKAREFADRYRDLNQDELVKRICDRCDELAGRGRIQSSA